MNKTLNDSVQISRRQLNLNSLSEAYTFLADNFVDEPRFVYLFQNLDREKRRETMKTKFFPLFMRETLMKGHSIWGMFIDGKLKGIAVWIPPGSSHGDMSLLCSLKKLFVLLSRINLKRVTKLFSVFDKAYSDSKLGLHWSLWYVAVDESIRREGRAKFLLEPVLQFAEEDKLPCVAMTFTMEATSFLKSVGFEEAYNMASPLQFWCMQKYPSQSIKTYSFSPNIERSSSNYYDPILLRGIEIKQELGSGKFGEVYLGEWRGTPVALKKLKNGQDMEEFYREAGILFKLRHPNIVQCLGIFKADGGQFIVCEYMPKGSLLRTLREEKNKLNVLNLLDMAIGAGQGLTYLENEHVIHRDVSARNLLCDNQYSVKVSDFGMSLFSLDSATKNSNTNIPIRWAAPELLKKNESTSKSDVYSFGIALFEIFSFGETPYLGMTNEQVIEYVVAGNRPPKPEACPDIIFDLMNSCWKEYPEDRPSFANILKVLQNYRNSIENEEKIALDDSQNLYLLESYYGNESFA